MARSLRNIHGQRNSTNEGGAEAAAKNAEKYIGMNEGQLMSELMSKASQGDVSPNELYEFYSKMSPYLTHDQRNKMRQLINMLTKKG